MTDNHFVLDHLDRALTYVNFERQYTAMKKAQLCESPMEAAFVVWFELLREQRGGAYALEPQLDVAVGQSRFRLDFAVSPVVDGIVQPAETIKLAIEIDGHDFHERTKQQVERRNIRDRALSSAGWTVLHFSGSEFHRSPVECVSVARSRAEALIEAWAATQESGRG